MDLHIPARGSKNWQILCPSWFAVCAACRVVVLTASKCNVEACGLNLDQRT